MASGEAPDGKEALVDQGAELLRGRRPEAAAAAFQQALRIDARYAPALFGMGSALLDLERPAEAAQALRMGFRLGGVAVEPLQKLATALSQTGEHQAAVEALEGACALDPHSASARFQRGMHRLQLAEFDRGWSDYEMRWDVERFRMESSGQVPAELLGELARGPTREQLAGRRILLIGEQAIGDQVMFASMLPDLLATAASVVCVCEPRLVGLLSASFPEAQFLPPREARIDADAIDLVLAMGSLGSAFRRSAAEFPGRPYLSPRPEARARWVERLGPAHGRRRIGVSWRGGGATTRTRARSLFLSALEPILTLPGHEFISLQHAETEAERAAAPGVRRFTPEELSDFEDLAALVANLDAVVAVQSSLVHLCGAIGAKCLTLVPFSPEWRYGVAGEAMPWYRSVRLFRQPHPGDWAPVIQAIEGELARFR